MELSTEIYYWHTDAAILSSIDTLFLQVRGDRERFIALAVELNPTQGLELAEDIIDSVDSLEHDLGASDIQTLAGFHIASFTHGSSGDDFTEATLLFLKALLPDLIVQAWGCGDDDPWEFWFKFDGDELIREDDEPLNDPDEDEEIRASIYAWWHEDLPPAIQVGFLKHAHEGEQEE